MSLRASGKFGLLAGIAFGTTAFAQTPAPLPPIDAHERVHWLVVENLAPGGLLETLAVAGIQTASNSPKEYGPHWTGFAKRAGLITGNYAVKAPWKPVSAPCGEDPRYDQTEGKPFGARLGHVIASTFTARNRAGNTMRGVRPVSGDSGESSFLYNTWMPDSQATTNQALVRTGLGFLSRMGENAWKEFIARRK